VICPHCRAALGVDARFCPACGKALVPTETQAQDSSPLMSALIGREIAGRFRILAKLGEGGMGAVYRGEQMSLKRAVAVKVLRPELSHNQQLLRRFSAEAEAVAKLDHPNTVKVYDFGQDTDGSLFIAMEYIEGGSLRDAMRAGPLPGPRAFAIAAQVAASLADAHAQSIIHRDLKPDNVMLQDKGRQRDIVRVLDFGIAKLRDDSRATQQMTQAGDMLGTPQYMAPEQIRGDAIDGRTDIYALGCMLYEMVTGRLPFEGTSVMAILTKHLTDSAVVPSQRRPELGLPGIIDQVVMVGMAKDPASRPLTMERYLELIGGALNVIDPNRSAGLAMPPVVVPSMPAPTPVPLGMTPIPPTVRAAPHVPPPAKPRNWIPWFVVLVAGIAIGGYVKTHNEPVATDRSNDATIALSDDPWKAQPSTPVPPSTPAGPTDFTPIREGTRVDLPVGFTRLASGPNGQTYSDPNRGMYILLAPLVPGTNDPDKLSGMWVTANRALKVQATKQSTMNSLGKQRTVLWFSAVVDGEQVVQMIILYIEPAYRLGLLVQFAPSNAQTMGSVLAPLMFNGVVIK
jgi:serine/threonine protein kinase